MLRPILFLKKNLKLVENMEDLQAKLSEDLPEKWSSATAAHLSLSVNYEIQKFSKTRSL